MTLRVAAIACVASCLLVALDLWAHRDAFDPEGISYLDMADAYCRGDWRAALVGLWSPLYPCLLALVKILLKPSAQWEFTAVHGLDFCIYLVALASFSLFMRELFRTNELRDSNQRVPEWAWLVFGYSLFTWSTIRLMPPYLPEPDAIICALVYLIFAMLFRIRRGGVFWSDSIVFGLLLGLGYWTKGIMFPMAFVFIGVALMIAGRPAKKLYKVMVAFAVFLLLSLPYVAVLSNANGRWVFSDAGRLNYAWHVENVKPYSHWQGEERVHGTPVHPTRKIYDDPPMYEFGTPFKVTYPPWYNPSYWYEGLKLRVNVPAQLRAFVRNTAYLLIFLGNCTGAVIPYRGSFDGIESLNTTIGSLVTLCCVLGFANLGRVSIFRGIAEYWFVLVPIGAALGAYALIHIEGRYIAPYVVVLWMVLFRSIAIPHSAGSKRIFTAVLACAALITAITLITGTGRAVFHAARYFVNGKAAAPFAQSAYTDWRVATYLDNAGLRAGDRVGAIGWTYSAYWARMARVHVVAEVPAEAATRFWLVEPSKRAAVMKSFRDLGVKAVIAKAGYINQQQQHVWDLRGLPGQASPLPISMPNSTAPDSSAPVDWQHIEGTDYYVYVFRASGE